MPFLQNDEAGTGTANVPPSLLQEASKVSFHGQKNCK
jgi:hypothetical protein